MTLTKGDLKEIEKIVNKTEVYLEDKIEFTVTQSEKRLENRFDNVEGRLGNVEDRLGNVEDRLGNVEIKIDNLKQELGDEVESLADFNREAIKRADKHSEKIEAQDKMIRNHTIRIKRLEVKV